MSLRLSGVSQRYAGGGEVLSGIDIEIAQGEQVAIIGSSGAGKTSLLWLLATGLRPSSGSLMLLGEDPWQSGAGARRRLRSRIGLIHQAPPLPPRQRVVTAVLAGRLGRWPQLRSCVSLLHPVDRDGAASALERLDLADRLFARCDQLSGGQLQRVGIARVLYQAPQLVLADEPVSAMDPVLAAHALRVLCDDARARGATLVASLHAVDLALAQFARVIGLRDGRVLFDRASADIDAADLDALYANEFCVSGQLPPAALSPPRAAATVYIPRC